MNPRPGFAAAATAMDAPAAAPAAPEVLPDLAERVRAALGAVIDPELELDVVTLGLIYAVEAEPGGHVRIDFTLTMRGCPMERVIGDGIRAAASAVPGVASVRTTLVWEPDWNPGMIRPGAW